MAGLRLKEYFTFTKRERNGIIVLLSLLVILMIADQFIDFYSDKEIVLMNENFKKEIDAFEKSLENKKKNNRVKLLYSQATNKNVNNQNKYSNNNRWIIPDSLFKFDPNIVKENELKKLGFSEKQVVTFLNFRKAGGCFYKKTDILKVYGISEEQYIALEPYIKVTNDSLSNIKKKDNKSQPKQIIVEINSTNADSLELINGIGPVYAERIIKYRNLLGGFVYKSQLYEVYGLDSVLISKIKPQIKIDSSLIRKINLNNADYKDLIKHPYLNKYQTQSILKFREIQGAFQEVDEITANNLLPEEVFQKIKPYLKK
ncbi:MAG: helix-hairpin-helix domain-containing protein [Thiohalospira sp.]